MLTNARLIVFEVPAVIRMLAQYDADGTVRLWCPGCGALSLAHRGESGAQMQHTDTCVLIGVVDLRPIGDEPCFGTKRRAIDRADEILF